MILYHGSPNLFTSFRLIGAGESTGIKFGYGVYLTESEASAVHYSQPRNMGVPPKHYLYTVEIPELTETNHLVSAQPVPDAIVALVEQKLCMSIPTKVKEIGKEFRKWVGCALTGSKGAGFEEEKLAAELFDSIGVLYNVWPTAQTKPNGLRNIAVFNPANVCIIKIEEIAIELKSKKWVMINRKDVIL